MLAKAPLAVDAVALRTDRLRSLFLPNQLSCLSLRADSAISMPTRKKVPITGLLRDKFESDGIQKYVPP